MDSDIAGGSTSDSTEIAGIDSSGSHHVAAHHKVGMARIFLLVAATHGFWSGSAYLSTLQEAPLQLLGQEALVIGVVLASWTLHPYNAALSVEELAMRNAAQLNTVSDTVYGHVEWQVSKVASFVQQFPLEEGALPGSVLAHHSNDHVIWRAGGDAPLTLRHLVEKWSATQNTQPMTFAKLAPRLAAAILSGASKIMHCVMVTGKINRHALFVRSDPSTAALTKFKRSTLPVDTSQPRDIQDLQHEVK